MACPVGAAPPTTAQPAKSVRKPPVGKTHRIHGTGMFTYIYHKSKANVGKYSIHGFYGKVRNAQKYVGCLDDLFVGG